MRVCVCAAGKLYGAEAEPVGLLLDLNAGSLSVFQVRAAVPSYCELHNDIYDDCPVSD